MGAAPRVCPGGSQGLPGSVCLPMSLHLHPWPPSLCLQPRPTFLSPDLWLRLVSPSWDPENGCGPPVLRKGLCPRLGPHPSGSLTGLTEASPFSPFSPFCLSGSPPQPPVMGEHLGARPGFKSHFHPLLTVDPRQVISLETQFVLLENGPDVTPCPQSCGYKGKGEGIRVESLGSPPTQPSPPGTLKHRGGLGCRALPCCTEGS